MVFWKMIVKSFEKKMVILIVEQNQKFLDSRGGAHSQLYPQENFTN